MDQTKLAAYLGLIQDLLSCPQGEEWIHLKRHEALVDAQFVQVMEQVAAQLARKGSSEAATFLSNWAAKLHHIFFKEVEPPSPQEDSSEAYIAFIQKLLSCPEGTENELISNHKALIGPGLVHKMREVARELRDNKEIATALSLEKMASQLNQWWIREHNFQTQFQKAPNPPIEKDVMQQVSAKKAPAGRLDEPDSFQGAEDIADPWTDSTEDESTPFAPEDVSESVAFPTAEAVPKGEPGVPSCEGASVETVPPSSEAQPSEAQPVAVTGPERVTIEQEEDQEDAQEQSGAQSIAAGLNAIATALQQLNQTLQAKESPHQSEPGKQAVPTKETHPLAHLEALERAYKAEWQLTTEEVEQLIGVRPRCHDQETVYQRGNWRFTKVGQMGNQTAWQVSRVHS